ncbi:MAG: carbonic anhydrase family protein [Cyanobacteria bacterium P01_B01_bin.77]
MVSPYLLIPRRTFLELSLAGILGQIPQWNYGDTSGPTHWADLSTDYRICRDGQRQSPIDLDITQATVASVSFDYHPITIDLLNNGRTIQQTGNDSCTLTLDNEVYQLLQFHFHTPSEHTYGGIHYPMELHLVHRHASTGALTVVGLWLKPGVEQSELTALAQYLPQHPGQQIHGTAVINPANFLPQNPSLVRYIGSLTTPPCTENVTWLMMTTPIEASTDQIELFSHLLGNNARPLQRLGS